MRFSHVLKKNLGQILLLAAFAFSAAPAKAGIFIEPYLGYELNLLSVDAGGANTKWAINNPAIGARVGYSFLMIWTALDYSMMSGGSTVASQAAGGTAKGDNFKRSSLLLDVGVTIPMLQAYAGYGLLNSLTHQASAGDDTYKGSAMKFGVSFTGFPIVNLNLEYMQSTYNKLNTGGSDYDIGGAGTSKTAASSSSVTFSVSASF